jgi:hypothetical protein
MEAILESFFQSEYFHTLLSAPMLVKMSQWAMVGGYLWFVMAKKVSKHFKNVEVAVKEVSREMSELKQVVAEDLKKGDIRMTRIEQRIENLEARPN